jgi:outer membrane protein OmpA-like peptidoglycan-associated protein
MPQQFLLRSAGLFFLLAIGLCSGTVLQAQFVVERSPWLDGGRITETPVVQTWQVTNSRTNEPLEAEFTVEGINPRRPVKLRIDEDTTMSLEPYRRYGRLCVESDFMLYSDYVYADPGVTADTIRLEPLAVGLEAALPGIEFMPGTEELYFTSIPALEALLDFVEMHPTVALAIIGHENDNSTAQSKSKSDRASRNRARAVVQYLVSSGVDANRLAIEGRGHHDLLYPNPQTPEEVEANRRITVRVTNY